MSTQPTSLKDLSPELLIQISQNLASFTSLSNLLSALPNTNTAHLRKTVMRYQFDICEAIAATELTPSLTPHFHALLKAQGDMQRLISKSPPASLTPAAMRTTGILSGGSRVGIDEAIQLESYLHQLRIWKPVFLEETRRMPRGCGNMFPDLLGRWNTLVFPEDDTDSEDSGSDSDGIFVLVDLSLEWQGALSLSGLSQKRHVRIERAWLNYWTMLFSRVGDERAHAAAVAGSTEGEYAVWTREYVKGVEECPEGVCYLAPMWEWLRFVPRLCEPVPAAGEEMWDVVMVGGFEYVCGEEVMGEEVVPVPVVGGAHMPPGVWGSGSVGEGIVCSLGRLRGLWVLDVHRSLWRGH
ncbi:uncharacterized protein H6S33_005115 [Morchella sextelata]|uniref:uncharacterized protein n=1 Tax=Morchella sextelata TaxID=1174677 RepID=UPI001D058E22|nr:uncharacterized protein H6S33_005115 [Morchella sextelata]KAH0605133.1 hypothetical protein H6S33_005115 [Morchella sextelata]